MTRTGTAAGFAAHLGVVVAVAAGVTTYMNLVFSDFPGQVYPILIALVAAIAWRLGAITAAVTLVASAGAIDWYVLEGDGLAISKPEQAAGMAILLTVGAAIIWSTAWLRRDRETRMVREADLRMIADGRRHQVEELVHRVRNDLAALSSIAQMYGRRPDPREAITAMTDRITVLGRLYQRLNLPEAGDARIEMRSFLEGVVADLRESHAGLRPISMQVVAEPETLPVRIAAVVALTVNEAVTNAIKYAFPNDGEGEILVSLVSHGEGRMLLEIGDDGVGPDGGPAKGTGMGTRLMRAMASQISGRHGITRIDGRTVVGLDFPKS